MLFVRSYWGRAAFDVTQDVLKVPGREMARLGFFLAKGFEIIVILELFLDCQELFIRENDEFLPAFLFNDLRVDAHGSAV
jgi:hypothetical protein